MCVVYIALNASPQYRLIIAQNRDESFQRRALPAHFWTDSPDILAGRDDRHGGTWLGVSRKGPFGCVTNYRKDASTRSPMRGRGHLVVDFLRATRHPREYATAVLTERHFYRPFSLILGNQHGAFYVSSEHSRLTQLSNGAHGLSNGDLNSPWPKVTVGVDRLNELSRRSETTTEDTLVSSLFEVLSDGTQARDDRLPNTGVEIELERALSSPFVSIPERNYGTRSSTVVLVRTNGRTGCWERTWSPTSKRFSEVSFDFDAEERSP